MNQRGPHFNCWDRKAEYTLGMLNERFAIARNNMNRPIDGNTAANQLQIQTPDQLINHKNEIWSRLYFCNQAIQSIEP